MVSQIFSLIFLILFVNPDDTDWKLEKNKDGIQIYTRLKQGYRIKGFKAVTTLDVKLESAVALVKDSEVVHEWYNHVKSGEPVEEFDFEEDVEGADHNNYTWANSAYAMAVNINRSFKEYGWCSRIRGIESGGAVEGLPTHTFPTDDGGVDMKCPTEIAIDDRREAELSKNGFLSLIHKKNSDFAAFIGAQSLQKPAEYDDELTIQTSITELPGARISFSYHCLNQEGAQIATAGTDLVFLNAESKRPMRCPEVILDKLKSYY